MTTHLQPTDDRLLRTLVELADPPEADVGCTGLLQLLSSRCVALLGVESAGVVLRDDTGRLVVAASTDGDAEALQQVELEEQEGPALEALRTHGPVQATAPGAAERWPAFTARAQAHGFSVFSAVPLRRRKQTLAALVLHRRSGDVLDEAALGTATALADLAAVVMLKDRMLRESHAVAQQLQRALTSRVVLEQAKGVLAARHDWQVDAAFEVMRDHARNTNRRLADVARAVVDGEDLAR